MHRQTALTIKEIVSFLANGSNWPDCLLANELGVIVFNGKDQTGQAEKALVDLLSHQEKSPRLIAYCFLTSIPTMAEKYSQNLASFWQNPKNDAEMKSWAEGMIERFKATNL